MSFHRNDLEGQRMHARGTDIIFYLYLLNMGFFLAVIVASALLVHGMQAHIVEIVVSVVYAAINGIFFYLFSSQQRLTSRRRVPLRPDLQAGDSVVEALYEGYYEVDLSGRIKAFNTSFIDILNVDPTHAKGMVITEFVDGKTAFHVLRVAHQVFHREYSHRALPVSYQRDEGNVLSLEVSITLIRDKHGEKTGFRGIVRNVSERKESERALAETAGRLRALLCAIPDAIAFKNERLEWLEANQAALQLFRISGSNYHGKSSLDMASFAGVEYSVIENFHELDVLTQNNGTMITREVVVTDKQGNEKMYEIRKIPVMDDYAKSIGVLSIVRDISLQHNMQQQLLDSERRYRSFIDHLNDGVVWMDLAGKVVDANPSCYAILGIEQTLVGHTMRSFVHGSDVSSVLKAFARVCRGELQEGIYRALRNDGEILELIMRFSPQLVLDQIVGVFILFRDVTQERRTTRQLQDVSRNQRVILQSAGEGIFGIDLDGRITFCNASALAKTMYEESEVIGFFACDVFFQPTNGECLRFSPPLLHSFFTGVRTSDESERVENALFYRKDGSAFYVDYVLSLMIDYGEIVGAVCLFSDVTERKRAEQALMQSEKLAVIGQLAAGIVHEIRNPLTVIKGFLTYSQGGNFKMDYVPVMNKEIDRIEAIIQEFLVLSRPQAMNLRWYDLSQVISDSLVPMRALTLQNNITVLMRIDTGLPLIQVEELQLRQAIMNLIKNAIESMPLGGEMRIEATMQDHHHVKVMIADEGYGIPEQQLIHVGEPFYTTKPSGTGLGVTVSQKVIEMHYGTLEIRSELGIGTTVEITLPIEHKERSVHVSMGHLRS
ncbi:MAG: PAS domain S-box protein [Acidibacillus sp.]|nr:PAS domain S-box protein [Acidibacillus sp.]